MPECLLSTDQKILLAVSSLPVKYCIWSLVLSDDEGAGLFHIRHAAGVVVAHSGEDDAQGVLYGIVGRRVKQHVYRGTMTTNQRSILDLHVVARTAALEQHVMIARCDQGESANDRVVSHGLLTVITAVRFNLHVHLASGCKVIV